jgi:hypothetical protein
MKSVYNQLLHSPNRNTTNVYYYLCNLFITLHREQFKNIISLVPPTSPVYELFILLDQNEPYEEKLDELTHMIDSPDHSLTRYFLYTVITNCINSVGSNSV